ncbi:hypothetical protein KUTeg_003066 [Tegillarca granosa]|uniref:DBB domain-containing protein n=1 Tax=Tegillarca granosa TaxID=220873 RepID=A0ABQ9FL13_TEGGR|nr:hypothetical protein KUTeg_003066 [Tegillarca granosa]
MQVFSMADSGQQECIYLYYIPSDGGSWANFLHEKLNEDDYMLSSSLVDISTLENDHLIHDVNIILVSPDFLNLKSLQPLTVLHQIRSLVVLLGVDKPEYEMFVKDNELNLSKWDVFETEATEKSVRQLLLRIISLYETSHPDEVHKHSAHIYYGSGEEEDYSTLSETRSKAEYAITPLVRESQASFSSSVTSSSVTESEYDVPLSRVDSYYDSPQFCSVDDYDVPPVTRPKSAMSFNSSDACYKSEKANNEVYRVLHNFTDEAQEVYILLNREACDEVMLVSDDGHIEELKLLNKNMFQVELKVPGQKYKIKEGNNVLGEIDTESFKKAHAQSKVEMIKELLLDETDPIALLCTSLGIPRKTSNSLDSFLEAKCKCPNIAKSLLEKVYKCRAG